jgi:nitrite reductase/ring-hydroxylating ferredoxin subunit
MNEIEISVGKLDELGDPGCREFQIGDGDWPLHGFVVRQGNDVYAYENYCVHQLGAERVPDKRSKLNNLCFTRCTVRDRFRPVLCRALPR